MEVRSINTKRREVIQLVFENKNELSDFISKFISFKDDVGLENEESTNNIINSIVSHSKEQEDGTVITPIFDDMCSDLIMSIWYLVQGYAWKSDGYKK